MAVKRMGCIEERHDEGRKGRRERRREGVKEDGRAGCGLGVFTAFPRVCCLFFII